MEKWELIPNVSVGKIRFGMTRDELHNLFEAKYTEFKKSKFSKNTADDYGSFHVFYTPDNLVEAVEFFEDAELELDGQVIFPINIEDIEGAIPGIEKEGNSFTHIEKSIGIEAEANQAESILIGAKGYYE